MLVARYFLNPKSKIEGLVSGLWLLLDLGFGSFSSSTPYRMMLRKCTSFDYEDEDDDEDDLIKIEAQNTIAVICFLSSVSCHLRSI
jgi:hypothetical protein